MTRPRLKTVVVGMLLSAGLVAWVAAAQEGTVVPLMEQLSVRLDFEEDVDADNFPDEWVLVVGRRHPQDIRVKLDDTEHHTGQRSFLMELDGIANVYETRETYRFDPRFSYRLTGYIRTADVPTTGLRTSAARIELVGIAHDRKTVVFSARTEGVTGTTDWTRVGLDLPRDVTRPFHLVRIRCIIDGVAISGKAWFDEITLTPRPGIHVAAGKPDGFFSPGDPACAGIAVDTLIESDYRLSTKLVGPDGRTVMDRTLDVKPRLGFLADADLALPLDTFGPYHMTVELTAGGRPVSSLEKTCLYWPGVAGGRVSPDFGVYAGGLGGLDDRTVNVLLESRFGTVGFDLFAGADGPDNITTLARRAAPRLGELRQQIIDPVVVLDTVPTVLVDTLFREKQVLSVGEATWLRTLSLDAKYASPVIAGVPGAVLARTVCWQIGRRADPNVSPADLARAVARLRQTLKPITFRHRVGVVFDGTETDEMVNAAAGCDFIVLDCGVGVDACRQLPERIARLRPIVDEVWVSLDVSRDDDAGPTPAAAFVERMVLARVAGADRVNVRFPGGRLTDGNGDPNVMTATAATLARELSGKQCAGILSTNVPTCLFVGPGGARLVVVPKPDALGDVLYLGTALRRIDLDGNVSTLESAGTKALLANRGRPYLVDGLDVEALLTRLSLRVANDATLSPQLWAEVRPQTLRIQMLGGFRGPVVGTLEIIAPDDWHIERPRQSLRLDPATPTVLETRVEVPITEVTGDHVLGFKLDLDGRQMVVRRRIALRPRTIDTVVSRRRLSDGTWRITQKITNHGDQEARLALFVVTGRTGRQESYVNGLVPGASAEVPFTLETSDPVEVWTGWRETSGPRFFNRHLSLVKSPE